MVSLHIALRQTARELYDRMKERVDQWMDGVKRVQDFQDAARRGAPPSNPDEKGGDDPDGKDAARPNSVRAGTASQAPSLHYEQVE